MIGLKCRQNGMNLKTPKTIAQAGHSFDGRRVMVKLLAQRASHRVDHIAAAAIVLVAPNFFEQIGQGRHKNLPHRLKI